MFEQWKVGVVRADQANTQTLKQHIVKMMLTDDDDNDDDDDNEDDNDITDADDNDDSDVDDSVGKYCIVYCVQLWLCLNKKK